MNSSELIEEFKLLEPEEQLVIKRVGNTIHIARLKEIGGVVKSCNRAISFKEMELSKIDALALGFRRMRELLSNTVGDALLEAVGLAGKEKEDE